MRGRENEKSKNKWELPTGKGVEGRLGGRWSLEEGKRVTKEARIKRTMRGRRNGQVPRGGSSDATTSSSLFVRYH